MARGRKPTIAPAVEILDPARDAQTEQAMSVMREMARGETVQRDDDRDILYQLLGGAQTARAFEEFSRTARVSKLAFVKENKLYRALKGAKNPFGAEILNGTWEEFCALLDRSVDQVDRDISNLRAFGEEALESMSRMGIGYRELRQFRRLPDDQKSALIEVAKAGDKDSLLELAEGMFSKLAREKEEAARQVEDLKGECIATRELLAERNKERDELRERLIRRNMASVDEKLALARKDAEATSMQVRFHVEGPLRRAVAELHEFRANHGIDSRMLLAGLFAEMLDDLEGLREEFAIPDARGGRYQDVAWIDETESDAECAGGGVTRAAR